MPTPVHLLIVEDSDQDTQNLVETLSHAGLRADYQRVETAEDFKKALLQNSWDVIVCDTQLRRFSEPAALEALKESKLDIPFIVISDTLDEQTMVETMKAGASNYISKKNLDQLTPTIYREITDSEHRHARQQVEWELEKVIETLTHDLRIPLLAEQQVLESVTLGGFGALSDDLQAVMQELLQSNYFEQHMLNNILDSYKYRQHKITLNKVHIDLNAFLEQFSGCVLVKPLVREKAVQIELDLDTALSRVDMDPHEIQRVMINLIKNAAEHSPYGGTVTISTQQYKTHVAVGVRDRGHGIEPSILPYIFKPFAGASHKKLRSVSVGLGLYVSKKIIEAHQGKIGFKSTQDEGTCFYFELPN